MKRSSLLLVVVGSLALLSGCAAKTPPPAPPLVTSPLLSFGGGEIHRLCFTKDNNAVCVSKTSRPDGSTEVKVTTTPLN